MSKTRIEGSFVATVTPFDRRGEIDFGAWQALLDHQQRHGTRAILFLGSTGEPSLLSPEEKKRNIVETVNMRTGRMPFFYARSEERRVGKACVGACACRWSPCHYKKWIRSCRLWWRP